MPFAGGIEDPANGALVLSAAAAFLYLAMLRREPSWQRTLAKAGSILILAVLAWREGGPALLVGALLLSALGDAFLAQHGEKTFLAGLASFLAAHLAYVALFWFAGGGLGALLADPWRIAAALAMVAFASAMLLRLRPALPTGMQGPVIAYGTAILAMGVLALTLSVPLVIAGAVLFMASDAILATERFLLATASPHRSWTGPAVWILYWLAQMAIAIGILA